MPVTVASAKRSFSKLKLLRNYLRSVMSQERLNSLATLCIEKGLLDEIDIDTIITDFASRTVRRNYFKWSRDISLLYFKLVSVRLVNDTEFFNIILYFLWWMGASIFLFRTGPQKCQGRPCFWDDVAIGQRMPCQASSPRRWRTRSEPRTYVRVDWAYAHACVAPW